MSEIALFYRRNSKVMSETSVLSATDYQKFGQIIGQNSLSKQEKAISLKMEDRFIQLDTIPASYS